MSETMPCTSHASPLAVKASTQAGDGKTPTDGRSDAEPFNLGSSLTVTDVGEMRNRLSMRLTGPGLLELDASRLEMIDGAGLQLLLAVFKQAAQQGCNITWRSPTRVLCRAAQTLGLATILRLGE